MAALYILAGLNHFRNPKMYIRIIPPFFKNPNLLNKLSGFAEIFLGVLLLFSKTACFAAWGIIALLIAIFPANFFMLTDKRASSGLPKWLLLLRIPMQFALIYWAYLYT